MNKFSNVPLCKVLTNITMARNLNKVNNIEAFE